MSDTPNNTLHADTKDTDHSGTDRNSEVSSSVHDTETTSAISVEHTATAAGTAQRDTTNPGMAGGVAASDNHADEVSDGHDGYEYHATTATDHELHGNDLRDSVLTGAVGDDKLVGGAVNTFELQSGNGHDLIFNFHASSDKLEIHRGLNGSDIRDTASLASHMHVSGNDVSFDLGGGNLVTLVGVDVGHLSEANLTWV